MSVIETVHAMKVRGERMAAFATLVGTFETPAERKTFIMDMYANSSISAEAAELLIEAFGLEAA
jgi:hypothetical protein